LQEGWVIANHILVSFHVAFISSVLSIPDSSADRAGVLAFIFTSHETLVSALFTFLVFHSAISLHELGHFLEAARLRALSDNIQDNVQGKLAVAGMPRVRYLLAQFLLIPYGRAEGVGRKGLNYYPDAPYNLAVAAAGPRASRNVARIMLPLAVLLLTFGLMADTAWAVYTGRLVLGLGLVCLLDFLLADPGKYREFQQREKQAADAASSLKQAGSWSAAAPVAMQRIIERRMQNALHPRLGVVQAPWQFRNCGMGGRHTEKEFPESNVSMQEAMFLILGALDVQEAQEMTVRMQNRLKEILEKAEGCRVMGIGLEGGLAPYVDRGEFELPELRLWSMMKQAIRECGYRPGEDVAIALDPALSELEIAYREEFDLPDSVGMYLFWRDHAKKVMDRDAVLEIYRKAIMEYDIPILSIEDGFSEDDDEGWRRLLESLGDRVLVVGDDLVTTNDRTIEAAVDKQLINSVLIKANQIGTLYETLLAILVSLGRRMNVIVSHRSKSPNDDMEAHFALAVNALGIKCGGGANTERLVKYQSVAAQMERVARASPDEPRPPAFATVVELVAREEPTNAGIPTVGADVRLDLPGPRLDERYRVSHHGATPLGTSAGTGEAIHLIDHCFEAAEFREIVQEHSRHLQELEPGVFTFAPSTSLAELESTGDNDLVNLFRRTQRYGGKGCLNAVDNVHQFLAPVFEKQNAADWSLIDIDRQLLQTELDTAIRRGKCTRQAGQEQRIAIMQRKQNIGMNAILSVSLALARALASLQGRELYELLREEVLLIIERLAEVHGVKIAGSRFDDYVDALMEVSDRLQSEDQALHEALREVTGIYETDSPVVAKAMPSRNLTLMEPAPAFAEEEQRRISELNRAMVGAYGHQGVESLHRDALRCYLDTTHFIRQRYAMFEIANQRVLRSDDALVVPYDTHGHLTLYVLRDGSEPPALEIRLPHGTLLNDTLISELAGVEAEVIDLGAEIYPKDFEQAASIQVARLRDMAALLLRLNTSGSRHEAQYLLRFLVAHLCSTSYRGLPGAKNLQNEINRVRSELVDFMNGPFAERMRLPSRVLVRSISGLVSRPKLIDEVWQDTIDLAEIHVRGSSISNEIRRRTHHAMGRHTLNLTRAYLQWLQTGDAIFPDPALEVPGEADRAAREKPEITDLVARIVGHLEQLLGSAQMSERVNEWRLAYAEELQICESGHSLQQELDSLVTNGIRAGNRWVYRHRLRSLFSKATAGNWSAVAREPFELQLRAMESPEPGDESFDPETAEKHARSVVDMFSRQLAADHQEAIFSELEDLLNEYRNDAFAESFEHSSALRHRLERICGDGVFKSQRYLLHQLDCLLEELGFFALRHVASDYAENGVDLDQCLRFVQMCAGNLHRDGLYSRELWDLSAMLVNPARASLELLNVLEQIQRNFHRLIYRVSDAYQVMADHLGYGEDEMRAVLGNFQRTMHDLNSLVHFSDLARAELAKSGNDLLQQTRGSGQTGTDPWDFIHLSDIEDIKRRVESRHTVSLQGRYGGKGAGLIYISYLGIPTRDGFIIPTALPRKNLHDSESGRLKQEVKQHLSRLEQDISRNQGYPVRLGDPDAPLLLAVRGGSVFSMPGMLSTVVFAGMTEEVAESLAREDDWFAWDAYRRFLVSFASARWNFDLEELDLVEKAKRDHGVRLKIDMPGSAMREVVELSKQALREAGHGEELEAIIHDAELQLSLALHSVHDSWERDRACRFRDIKHLSDGWHTAVIIQQMACGNRTNQQSLEAGMDEMDISLTGVIPHTRMQETGFREFTGDVKFSACGDDLVGGVTASQSFEPVQTLRSLAPMLERKLYHISARLRRFLGSDAEIEFTVERGVLSILQVRSAELEHLENPRTFLDPGPAAGQGIGIRGGAFRGVVAFNEAEVDDLRASGRDTDEVDGILLVIENPIPDEIPLILSVDGLLAARGGSTSHAAVAVHAIEDRPYSAVLGVEALRVRKGKAVVIGASGQEPVEIKTGDILSIHGQTGDLYVGSRRLKQIPERKRSAKDIDEPVLADH
jgi:enolase/phosphoenolpyruvate synthase/pyruvate phosphate dikinase